MIQSLMIQSLMMQIQSLMLQSKYYHRPNYSYSYPPGPGQHHHNFIGFIGLLTSPRAGLQREQCCCKIVNLFVCFISIFDKSDSDSSLLCPETFKPKTFLKPAVLIGFWQPPSRNHLFHTVFVPILLQDHRRYEGARPTATTTTRFHIDLVQTLHRPHIAFVRLRAELAETLLAMNP